MFYLDLMAINPIPIVSLTSFPATLWPHKLLSVFQTSYVCPHLGAFALGFISAARHLRGLISSFIQISA